MEEKRRKEEEAKKRREEEVRRKREEEVKRRRDTVMTFCKQAKVTPSTTSEEDESLGGRVGAPRSRKFLNLFAQDSSHYSATGGYFLQTFSFKPNEIIQIHSVCYDRGAIRVCDLLTDRF